MKTCTKCNKLKELTEFTKNKKYKDSLSYWCKECHKKYRAENFEKIKVCVKNYFLKGAYGITSEYYYQMLKEQNGVCKICGGVNKNGYSLYIDHCHKTNKVRGLLCHNCNLLLGYSKDAPELLQKTIDYLKLS